MMISGLLQLNKISNTYLFSLHEEHLVLMYFLILFLCFLHNLFNSSLKFYKYQNDIPTFAYIIITNNNLSAEDNL